MHSVDDRKEIFELPPEESDVESGHCHPRFIAYMLRLGDLLDLSSERFDALSLLHYGKLPEMSELHKKSMSRLSMYVILIKQLKLLQDQMMKEYVILRMTGSYGLKKK